MSDTTSQLADLLLAARRDMAGGRIATLPEALKPKDMAAALAVQHKVAQSFTIGGWKVGAPGGVKVCGALPAATIQPSPAKLSAAQHPLRMVESEVAFRMKSDLPPRATPYTKDEVAAAIDTMHPAIEVCESRFVEPKDFDMLANVADTQSHGGFVYGPAAKDWRKVDLAAQVCRQFVNSALDAERTGYPFGDILDLMLWLANEGSTWAGGLKAGQFVTCGSWSGANRVPAGATVRAEFPGLGEAQIAYVS
ncbi:MAG: 2-keto-4-pentenoate hydratase [Acetobacteraceae bacterium]|nr:2-keto-4-pentenoate hydratase [Acetobacteraceae bacterium]